MVDITDLLTRLVSWGPNYETNENHYMQHQDIRVEDSIKYGDTIDGVDFDYAAKLTNLNAVVMASMAWALPPR